MVKKHFPKPYIITVVSLLFKKSLRVNRYGYLISIVSLKIHFQTF